MSNEIIELHNQGLKVHEIAEKLKKSKGCIYTTLSRNGLKAKDRSKCKEAVDFSKVNGVKAAAEKFGMKKEAIYSYRAKYKKEEK